MRLENLQSLLLIPLLFCSIPVIFADSEMPILDIKDELEYEPKKSSDSTDTRISYQHYIRETGDVIERRASVDFAVAYRMSSFYHANFESELVYMSPRASSYEARVHEAYVDYENEWILLSLGQIKSSWGVMDFTSPVNLVSGIDYSQGISTDIDQPDLGSPQAKILFNSSQYWLEVLFKPYASTHLFPGPNSPWSFSTLLPTIAEQLRTSTEHDYNPALGLRFGSNFENIFYRLSFYRGYEQYKIDDINKIALTASKIWFIGIDIDFEYGGFIFKGEVSHGSKRRYYFEPPLSLSSTDSHYTSWATGFDYTYDVTSLIFELSGSIWQKGNRSIFESLEDREVMSMNVQHQVIRDRLIFKFTGQNNFEFSESLLSTSLEYQLSPLYSVELGAVVFNGKKDKLFGIYRENDYSYVQFNIQF